MPGISGFIKSKNLINSTLLKELLKYKGSEYSKYTNIDFEKEFLQPHITKNKCNYGRKILIAASIEIWLRHIRDISRKENNYVTF